MLKPLLVATIILCAAVISVRIRVERLRSKTRRRLSLDVADSALANALRDFAAIAGGVYLGINGLIEFLKIPVPKTSQLMGISFDPVALLAVFLAILSPMISKETKRS